MAEIKGAALVARSLKDQGLQELFGVVGFPVTEIAYQAQEQGLRYIGTRHEQTAGFAAQAISYLRGHVGAALTITGPGMTNAVTALGNAWANCWPFLLISGSADRRHSHRGAFQDAPQLDAARPFCKWVGQATRVEEIPRLVAQAVRKAWHGRPGPVYLDVPADVINGMADEDHLEPAERVEPPPRPGADPAAIDEALALLRGAERPLLIVGKGAAWADAAPELRHFADRTGIPFLPSPMGKGVIPDDHPGSIAAARSYALKNADVILAVGVRFNWMMHFGLPPRYSADVKVIQIDIAPDDTGTNVPLAVSLAADAKTAMAQIAAGLEEAPWQCDPKGPWRTALAGELEKNRGNLQPLMESGDVPMGYYRPLMELQRALPQEAIVIAEGANTMDISRAILENYRPRHRLDAGSWGTMGVGVGYALAAAVAHPETPVVALMGDGAFGFSGMDVEVAVRYKLPITWVIFNNNGIGSGVPELPEDGPPPVQVFSPGLRYDKMMEAFGGKGYYCETPDELSAALKAEIGSPEPALISVAIDPAARPFSSRYAWLA
ncbi:MAG: oxalyl-CoA decarboxylase [SAR324 cluster bacterium]|nr:oxalyl-CoA decarboxylase [SAR324 cluster bacterium]